MKELFEIIKEQWKLILLTAIVTLFVTFGVWGGEKFFSSDPFCLSCHSMSYVNAELKESGHFDTGIGPNPECQDCHLPPQFLLRVESHIVDGIRAVIGEFKNDLSTKEGFDEHRLEYAHNARMNLKKWNSSPCTVMCHRNPQPPGEAEEEHKKMETEGATCIDCHQNLVHDEVEEEDLDEGLRLGKIVLKEEEDEEDDEGEEEEEE